MTTPSEGKPVIGINNPTLNERMKEWENRRHVTIRPADNGFIIEISGGVAMTTLRTYVARTPEDVVEIVAQIMRVDAEIARPGRDAP